MGHSGNRPPEFGKGFPPPIGGGSLPGNNGSRPAGNNKSDNDSVPLLVLRVLDNKDSNDNMSDNNYSVPDIVPQMVVGNNDSTVP